MASNTSSRNLSSTNRDSFPTTTTTTTPTTTPASSAPDVSSVERTEKIWQITAACRDRDLPALLNLATSKHGLINDELRRTAWPILLGCRDEDASSQSETTAPWRSLPAHRDEYQVGLDVNRAFVYYPKGESDRQLEKRKDELSDVIVEVLRRHPALYYSQGYHDIVQVVLLVLGAQEAPAALTRLTLLRIRDFMLPSLEPAIAHLELIPPIIQKVDAALYEHFPKMQPSFALAATLTLFAHVVQEYGDIARLFDFFLSRETVIPIYLFAVIILSRRDELLEIDDPDMLYVSLGKLPQPLDLESLITQTIALHASHPPESLRHWAWWRVSSSSVLKATRSPQQVMSQTLEQAEAFFQKQVTDLRRHQAMAKIALNVKTQYKRHKRPAGAVGLAILVGVYAWWLGRAGWAGFRLFGAWGVMRRVMGMFV